MRRVQCAILTLDSTAAAAEVNGFCSRTEQHVVLVIVQPQAVQQCTSSAAAGSAVGTTVVRHCAISRT
jgi:hypothetical protein